MQRRVDGYGFVLKHFSMRHRHCRVKWKGNSKKKTKLVTCNGVYDSDWTVPIYKSCCCWHTAPGSPTQTKLRCQPPPPPPPPPFVVIVVPPQNTTVKMGTARALKRQLKGKCAVVVILCRKLYYFRGIYARYITHEDDRTKRLFIIIRFSCVVFSSKKRNNNNKTFKSQTHTCTLTKWWWCCCLLVLQLRKREYCFTRTRKFV